MAKGIRLRKLVRRDEVAAVLAAVSGGEDAVVDAKGRLLAGPSLSGPSVEVTGPDGTATPSGPRARPVTDHSMLPASASTAHEARAPGQEPTASASGALTPAATAPPSPRPAV